MENLEGNQPSVLIIDDDPSQWSPYKRPLEHNGYKCECVGDGIKALQLLADKHFDAVIMDLGLPQDIEQREMPERTDVENGEWIYGLLCKSTTAPILITSGYMESIAASEAIARMRPASVLPKPFFPEELISAVNNLLER